MIRFLPPSRQKIILPFVLFLAVLLAAYSPMALYTHAQAADTAKVDELRTKIKTEIQKRLDSYKKTLSGFKVDVHVSADDTSADITLGKDTSSDGTSAQVTKTDHDFCKEKADTTTTSDSTTDASAVSAVEKLTLLPCGIKDAAKGFLQKIVDELTNLLSTANSTTDFSKMLSIANNVDGQSGIDQLTQSQAAGTQAVSSMTSVLTALQSAFGTMQDQVSKIKSCVGGASDGTTSATATISTTDGVNAKCGDLSTDGLDTGSATAAQGQLDSITNIITQMSSVLLSAITLLTTLATQFSSLTSGMGSLGSLGNLGNLSSLTSLGSGGSALGSLGSLGSLTSLLGGGSGGLSSLTSLLGGTSGLSSLTSLLGSSGGGNASDLGSLLGSAGSLSSLSSGGLSSLSSLGSLGSISDLSSLSSLGGLGSLGGLVGSSGDMSGMMQAFSSILPQLSTLGSMSGGAFGGLSSLANSIDSSGTLSKILDIVGSPEVLSLAQSVIGGSGSSTGGFTNSLGGFSLDALNNASTSSVPATTASSSSTTSGQIGVSGDFTGSRNAGTFVSNARNGNCTVDYSHALGTQQFAINVMNICNKEYANIANITGSYRYAPPVQMIMIPSSYSDSLGKGTYCLPTSQGGIGAAAFAYVDYGRVYSCVDYFAKNPQDVGTIVHEMTHLTQKYPSSVPSWITEGIADYVRTELGYDQSFDQSSCSGGRKYTDGYKCADALFHYIARQYNQPNFVKSLHLTASAGHYTDAFFQQATSRSLSTLYIECMQAECKGGASV